MDTARSNNAKTNRNGKGGMILRIDYNIYNVNYYNYIKFVHYGCYDINVVIRKLQKYKRRT